MNYFEKMVQVLILRVLSNTCDFCNHYVIAFSPSPPFPVLPYPFLLLFTTDVVSIVRLNSSSPPLSSLSSLQATTCAQSSSSSPVSLSWSPSQNFRDALQCQPFWISLWRGPTSLCLYIKPIWRGKSSGVFFSQNNSLFVSAVSCFNLQSLAMYTHV